MSEGKDRKLRRLHLLTLLAVLGLFAWRLDIHHWHPANQYEDTRHFDNDCTDMWFVDFCILRHWQRMDRRKRCARPLCRYLASSTEGIGLTSTT
jgi:hypothetical protein